MHIITKPITITEIKTKHANFFETLTKAVIDLEKKIIAIDAEMHADLEKLLLEKGSSQKDLWGFNIYLDLKKNIDELLEYTSLINIRPHQNNRSMIIQDENLKKQIKTITQELILIK